MSSGPHHRYHRPNPIIHCRSATTTLSLLGLQLRCRHRVLFLRDSHTKRVFPPWWKTCFLVARWRQQCPHQKAAGKCISWIGCFSLRGRSGCGSPPVVRGIYCFFDVTRWRWGKWSVEYVCYRQHKDCGNRRRRMLEGEDTFSGKDGTEGCWDKIGVCCWRRCHQLSSYHIIAGKRKRRTRKSGYKTPLHHSHTTQATARWGPVAVIPTADMIAHHLSTTGIRMIMRIDIALLCTRT